MLFRIADDCAETSNLLSRSNTTQELDIQRVMRRLLRAAESEVADIPVPDPVQVAIDPETQDRLRDLGYVK